MSIFSLCQNWFSIQTSESAAKTDQGALNRLSGWADIEVYKNLRCALQEQTRSRILIENFAYIVEEHYDVLFHMSRSLYEYVPATGNQSNLRVLVATDPRDKLVYPLVAGTYKFYDFWGHFENVRHNSLNLFMIKCSRNEKHV
jgi:hypothetical protein